MTPFRLWHTSSRLALTGALGAGVCLGSVALNAIRLDPLPRMMPGQGTPAGLHVQVAQPMSDSTPPHEALVLSTVNRDPFRPDRRRPAERYLMPGERRPVAPVRLPVPSFRLVGTVMAAAGELAVLQLPGQGPRMVQAGDTIQGYRLRRVEAGAVVLEGPDTTITVQLDSQRRGARPN